MRLPLFHLINRNSAIRNATLDSGEITIRVLREGSRVVVNVAGRVTVDSSPRLRSVLLRLIRRGADPVILVDLAGVSYVDMSGLATLFEALRAAQRSSRKLLVVGITGQSKRLAEMADLDRIFLSAGSEVRYQ